MLDDKYKLIFTSIIFLIIIIIIFQNENKFFENFTLLNFYSSLPNSYLVQNNNNKDDAAKLLADINNNIRKLIFYLMNKIKINEENPNKYTEIIEYIPYIKTIYNRLDGIVFREIDKEEEGTSYTINKGDEMVICLRSGKKNKLHNINDIMYVVIHEISHVGCPEQDHTSLFYKINKFLLKQSIELGIYNYVDYNASPREYCNIDLNNTIL